MSNETFLAIAIAVAASVFLTLFFTKWYNDKKASGDYHVTIAELVNHVADISKELYDTYMALGGINRSTYDTDKAYREEVLSKTIDIILDTCNKNNITVPLDKTVLFGLAKVIVENVIAMCESQDNTAKISSLEAKVADLSSPKLSTDAKNPDTVTIKLGDFYENNN